MPLGKPDPKRSILLFSVFAPRSFSLRARIKCIYISYNDTHSKNKTESCCQLHNLGNCSHAGRPSPSGRASIRVPSFGAPLAFAKASDEERIGVSAARYIAELLSLSLKILQENASEEFILTISSSDHAAEFGGNGLQPSRDRDDLRQG